MTYLKAISILKTSLYTCLGKQECRQLLNIFNRELTIRDCKKCILTEYCSHDSMMTKEIIINDLNKKARNEKLAKLLS